MLVIFCPGCYNISTETAEKIDCKQISLIERLNRTDDLPLIGIMVSRLHVERICLFPWSIGNENDNDKNVAFDHFYFQNTFTDTF